MALTGGSVVTGTARFVQSIPADDAWHELEVDVETDSGTSRIHRIVMPEGRTIIMAWASIDEYPEDPERVAMLAELVAAGDKAKAPWRLAIDKAVRLLLKDKRATFSYRITRHLVSGDDFTERDTRDVPSLRDIGFVYMGELWSDGISPLSVDVQNDGPATVRITAVNVHMVHVAV